MISFLYWWPIAVAYVAWKIAGYPALGQIRDCARHGSWTAPWSWASGNAGSSRFAAAYEAARNVGGTGNAAFDAYRRAELNRLEARRRALQEESRAFSEFVEELKRARDREQFDAFMAKRRAENGPTYEA